MEIPQANGDESKKPGDPCQEMMGVVRCGIPIVYKFRPESPSQKKWKADWLAKAYSLLGWKKSPSMAMELASLIDGAYNVVELSEVSSNMDRQWRDCWLADARRLVPSSSSLWI